MRKILFPINILVCLLLLVNPSIIAAEEDKNILSMEELSIKIMPEFAYHPKDMEKKNPPLLIGYQGTMLNHSDQPQKGQIEIPLPMDEKNFRIGYVADYSSDLSKVFEIEYIVDQEKGTISWTTSEEIQPNEVYKFIVEFYTDSIEANNKRKSLTYQFKSFANIGIVNFTFVEPEKTKKWKIDPAPEEKKTHADEKGSFSYHFQGVNIGEEKSFNLKYERSETIPTMELINSQDQALNEEKAKKTNTLAIASFSIVGLIAIFTIIFLLKKRK